MLLHTNTHTHTLQIALQPSGSLTFLHRRAGLLLLRLLFEMSTGLENLVVHLVQNEAVPILAEWNKLDS